MAREGLGYGLAAIVPEGIDAVIIDHLTENKGQVNAYRFRFFFGELFSRPILGIADLLQHREIGEQLSWQEEIPPISHSHVVGFSRFLALRDLLIRHKALCFPLGEETGKLLLGGPHRIQISLSGSTKTP